MNRVFVSLGEDKELVAGSLLAENSVPVALASDQLISIAEDDTSFIGQVKISGSGVFVNGPDISHTQGFMLASTPSSNQCYVCVHGTSGSGFPLDYSNKMVLGIGNLQQVDFYADGAATICWHKL